MAETEERAERTELCPLCREGVLKIRTQDSDSCNFCNAVYDRSSGRIVAAGPNVFPANDKTQIYRMGKRRQRERIDNAADRNLAFALSELNRLAMANNLPNTARDTSVSIYRKAVSRNMLRGRSVGTVAAATTYAACRIRNIPRTLDEIAESGGISRRELGRTYRFVSRGLKLNILPAKPQDYAERLCSALNASVKIHETSVILLNEAEKHGTDSGANPNGLSAGAVYLASSMCGKPYSQREIAGAAGITRATLRNGCRRIAETLDTETDFGENEP